MITYSHSHRIFQFVDIHTKTSHKSGGYAVFDHWIYKNHFWFKKCFNIASTTDEYIFFYLNNHSHSLTHFKHIKRHKLFVFLIYM